MILQKVDLPDLLRLDQELSGKMEGAVPAIVPSFRLNDDKLLSIDRDLFTSMILFRNMCT